MRQFADRFKVMLLDDVSRLGASMIAQGGCYWRNGSGGLAIAHVGSCIQLNARQAHQIRAVLPIEINHVAARLPRERVGAHIRDLLVLPDPVADRHLVDPEPARQRSEREVC